MSKMFRVIWTGLVLLLVLAACAPAPTAAPTAAPPTAAPKSSASSSSAASSSAPASSAAAGVSGTITIWNGYHTGDNEEKTLNQLLDAAKKAYPDAKINVLEIPFDQLFNKFETEAAKAIEPDRPPAEVFQEIQRDSARWQTSRSGIPSTRWVRRKVWNAPCLLGSWRSFMSPE